MRLGTLSSRAVALGRGLSRDAAHGLDPIAAKPLGLETAVGDDADGGKIAVRERPKDNRIIELGFYVNLIFTCRDRYLRRRCSKTPPWRGKRVSLLGLSTGPLPLQTEFHFLSDFSDGIEFRSDGEQERNSYP